MQNNWDKLIEDLGSIKQKVRKIIHFNYLGDKKIVKLTSSCGCSTPELDGTVLEVNYLPGAVPKHLIFQGYYTTAKTITITYEDGTFQILLIKARVIV